ncbi:MAG: hypothetical protein Q7J57_06195 [Gemmobacter sp.]|nr:hypothetical protein [Gemmobacter sp.]
MQPAPPLPDVDALRKRLNDLRQSRGFLLAHHGALAAAAPDLHDAYVAMYQALTVRERHLAPLERETVWLGILIAAREGIGTHHLELFRAAGGTTGMARALTAMTGFAEGFAVLQFAQQHWSGFLPGLDPAGSYVRGLDALRGDAVAPDVAELAMLAVQTIRMDHAAIAHHLTRCYALAIPEDRMVEALAYVIWPRGVNTFLDACAIWHDLMVAGVVRPSPRYQVWADTPAGPFKAGSKVGGFTPG